MDWREQGAGTAAGAALSSESAARELPAGSGSADAGADVPRTFHGILIDSLWLLFSGALAAFGPSREPGAIALLLSIGVFQIAAGRVPWFRTKQGNIASFAISLLLCYILIYFTGGIESSYYWILLVPVIAAATAFSLFGALVATALAAAAYLSFLTRINWQKQYIPGEQVRELVLRCVILPLVGSMTNHLAEANRVQARRAQEAAAQLAEANQHLLEAEAAVRRTERLAALGQLSAGLAHELRNPLGTIKTSAELLTRHIGPDNAIAAEMAGYISSEVDRSNMLVTRFLDFARPLAIQPQRADITQIIDRAVADLERQTPPLSVSVYRNYSPDVRPFLFDPDLMERVFYNLLLNAAQASPPQSSVTVKTRQVDDAVEIAVIDRGGGIDAKNMESIFNPFFTTKAQGVGLGLAVVSRIVDEHGGRITVESEPGAGSIFRVTLPAREMGE